MLQSPVAVSSLAPLGKPSVPAERNPPGHIKGTAELAHKQPAPAKGWGAGRSWRIFHGWQDQCAELRNRGWGCSRGHIPVGRGQARKCRLGNVDNVSAEFPRAPTGSPRPLLQGLLLLWRGSLLSKGAESSLKTPSSRSSQHFSFLGSPHGR